MKVQRFFFLLCCGLISEGYAQSLRYTVSMPYISLNACSRQQADAFSFTGNQAALAAVKEAGIGMYGERRFLLAENNVYAMAAAIPTSMGHFGIQLKYAGFSNYNENNLGLAYGRSLGNKLDLGVQFNYYSYRVPTYGNASSINFELGAILHLASRFNAGIHIFNPVGGKLSKGEGEKLAAVYRFSLGYDASEQFFAGAELIKEEDKPVNVSGGLQYQFKKQFFARLGFISETGSGFGGAGVSWKHLRLDLSVNFHPQLGFTPGLLLIVQLKRKRG